jgi:hypothetical protein
LTHLSAISPGAGFLPSRKQLAMLSSPEPFTRIEDGETPPAEDTAPEKHGRKNKFVRKKSNLDEKTGPSGARRFLFPPSGRESHSFSFIIV